MNKIKIYWLHCGRVRVSEKLPYGDGNFLWATGLFTRRADRIWLPVSALYIEHPQAKVLIDTGWHRDMSPNNSYDRNAQIAHMSLMLYMVNQGVVGEGETVVEQLATLGVKPSDLDYVLLSHLDVDHVSALKSLTAARNILVSEPEMNAATRFCGKFRYCSKMWHGTPIRTFRFGRTGLGPMEKSYDLLGDGSVQLIWTPGHSEGMFSTKVTGRSGKYFIYFADAGYGSRSWQQLVLPGICDDKELARTSLEWVREESLDDRCVASFACHDPAADPCRIEL